MAQGRFVAYYRVSTDRQGRSGLGLEAQREAVRSYLDGGSWQLVEEVVEVESGKRNDRPKLAEALKLCRLHQATLIIAKLDRLARNVAFVSNLMESGVDFVAVDFPQANRLTVHILAAVAEHEAAMISQRTKAALRRCSPDIAVNIGADPVVGSFLRHREYLPVRQLATIIANFWIVGGGDGEIGNLASGRLFSEFCSCYGSQHPNDRPEFEYSDEHF
jgi:hypothetical protein